MAILFRSTVHPRWRRNHDRCTVSGYDQGYQAVKTVVAHLNGEKVDSFVDCGTKVIDSTTAEDYMATLKSQMDGKAVAQ